MLSIIHVLASIKANKYSLILYKNNVLEFPRVWPFPKELGNDHCSECKVIRWIN